MPRASTWRPATSLSPAASWPRSRSGSRQSQRVGDALGELGELAKTPEANIIKLPNISASLPQLKEAIAELQAKGYAVPDFPEDPQTDEERDVRARYDKVKGSAVNPVLREGNSDRRAPASVKAVRPQPPALDGRVVAGLEDECGAHDRRRLPLEREVGCDRHRRRRAHRTRDADGTTTALRAPVKVLAGEVVDATVMRVAALRTFLDAQIARAETEGVLFSVHLKATMMKVSDPIIFGHVVQRVLPGAVRRARRRTGRRRHLAERRPRHAAREAGRPANGEADRGRDHAASQPRARRWPWSTPTAASRTCTSRAT